MKKIFSPFLIRGQSCTSTWMWNIKLRSYRNFISLEHAIFWRIFYSSILKAQTHIYEVENFLYINSWFLCKLINIHIYILPTFFRAFGFFKWQLWYFLRVFCIYEVGSFLGLNVHKFFILLTIHNSILSTFSWRFGVIYTILLLVVCNSYFLPHV